MSTLEHNTATGASWSRCALLASLLVLAGSPAALAQNAPEGRQRAVADRPPVHVSEHMTVDLHLRGEDLSTVLQMLAIQSERNIVASSAVSGKVTADLYGASFYDALDAVLHIGGYGYIEKGEFIYVYTLDELSKIQQATARPIAKVIRLDYLNANDAASFVEPLLSAQGKIKANGDVSAFSISDAPAGDESFALSATLVVYDYPEHVREIEALIKQLDTRPAQVLVESTILQTQLTEDNAFGIDFSIVGNLDLQDFTAGPLSAFNALRSPEEGAAAPEGRAIVSTPGNTTGPGTLKIGIVHDDIAVFIRLLDEVADTTILSNPKILALNRQPARVLVGARVGYLSTTATETSSTQTVEFLDTGTQLAFRPFISNDGMIRMELRPSVSEAVIRQSTDANGVIVSIPDELTQEIITNVIVRDGSTIVLGGLFKETTRLERRQTPFLGDIPVIGAAFRGHEDSTKRDEIIFLVRPTIVNDSFLADVGAEASETLGRVRAGTRQGLLPWSRDKMTAKLNLEADELARQGEHEKAMWKLRRSLELNPTQPDAIRLREGLVNEKERWPSRNMLESMLREEFGIRGGPPLLPPEPQPEPEPVRDTTPSAPALEAEDRVEAPAKPAAGASDAAQASAKVEDNAAPASDEPMQTAEASDEPAPEAPTFEEAWRRVRQSFGFARLRSHTQTTTPRASVSPDIEP